MKLSFTILFCLGIVLSSSIYGNTTANLSPEVFEFNPQTIPANTDISEYQKTLLTLGFDAASLLPQKPLIKTRSRLQEEVVAALLTLNQPKTAYDYIEKIQDWRRALSFASLAYYLAEKGEKENSLKLLKLAEELSKEAEDWRLDQIRVRIAQTYVLLGNNPEAIRMESEVKDAEKGIVNQTTALVSSDDSFTSEVLVLDELNKIGLFDLQRNAVETFAVMYDRYFEQVERRDVLEERITAVLLKFPANLRFETPIQLAKIALKHGNQAKALQLVEVSQKVIEEHSWEVEYMIPMHAKVGEIRFLAGQQEQGLNQIISAETLFNEKGTTEIQNFFRPEALIPLAEVYFNIGKKEDSLRVYKLAVQHGAENVNGRPRVEDFTAICISLALTGLEPDEELWASIHQTKNGLREPW